MITTKNFYRDVHDGETLHQCPNCGHRGRLIEFKFELPGIVQCQDRDQGTWYEVHFPGEAQPRKFQARPTVDEILRELEKLQPAKVRRLRTPPAGEAAP